MRTAWRRVNTLAFEALLAADEIEDRRGQVLAGAWLGFLLWEEDDRQARTMIERALRLAREIGFYRAESISRAILARVLHEARELSQADKESAQAQELMERHAVMREVGLATPDRRSRGDSAFVVNLK